MPDPIAAAKQKFGHEAGGFPTCHCPASRVSLQEWCDLVRHKPPPDVMRELQARGMSLHDIERAAGGQVNLDYYPVEIDRLPPGMTADDLQQYIRTHPAEFFDHDYAVFNPYGADDAKRWANDPLGTVFNIDMGSPGIGQGYGLGNLDDGSVVASAASNRRWIFSTVWSWGDGNHPVSGNREFGYTDMGNGEVVFYTRAADRLTTNLDAFVNWSTTGVTEAWRAGDHLVDQLRAGPFGAPFIPYPRVGDNQGLPFEVADRLWKGYQSRVAAFVNGHGGSATVGQRTAQRIDWKKIDALCK